METFKKELLGLHNEGFRVARTKQCTSVLGPGQRAVIWFHGCSLKCPGCIAFEMNHSAEFTPYTPRELYEWVHGLSGIEGITLSGGDPFDQPGLALLEFLQLVRKDGQLSVMCYTGRTLEELMTSPENDLNRQILDYVDILVDGPYEQLKNEGHQWRGSSNQKIHFLTERYMHLRSEILESKNRGVEIDLSLDNRLTLTGIPEIGFIKRLRNQLESRGVDFRLEAD